MSDVKWIKICTDIFDDEKILLIESMPDRDSVIVIWFKLLCMAGKQNNNGIFTINDKIPYTDEMLATIFRRPLNTVRLALSIFEQYGMIEIVNDIITIPKWEKHQSLDQLNKIRESTRKRVANYREKQKSLVASNSSNAECNVTECVTGNVTSVVTVTSRNAIDKEREKEKEKDKEKKIDYQQIADMYNSTCVSFPRLTSLSESRKKAIKARLNTYSIEQFQEVFRKAEASDFMKGKSNSNWTATFDWMMKDSNFAKILDGNYDNNKQRNSNNNNNYNTKSYNLEVMEV